MITFEKSIEVDAPVEQVFAYLLDPVHGPEYMTGTDEVKDIQRLPDGRYTYTTVSKFLGLHWEDKTEQTEVIPNERIVQKSHGGGVDGVVTERLEPLEGDKTRVSVAAESTLHGGPLAKFGEAFLTKYMHHGVEMAMEAAKAHIETEVGAATPS
jgi:uncharacterized membrane protein